MSADPTTTGLKAILAKLENSDTSKTTTKPKETSTAPPARKEKERPISIEDQLSGISSDQMEVILKIYDEAFEAGWRCGRFDRDCLRDPKTGAVSYTHLTLPTKASV